MVLENVKLQHGGQAANLLVEDGLIRRITAQSLAVNDHRINLDGALVIPGLINSHDHLDFNLYPKLGDSFYRNYTEWGHALHQHFAPEIQQVLKVPLRLRRLWGVYKNLLCGVTTVVEHGERFEDSSNLITVFQNCLCLHSVQFEKMWKVKLNNPFKDKQPVAIHAGEGVDELAMKEIDDLISWNLLSRTLVGIHGIAMEAGQAEHFEALVWCPESNYFMFNKTASVDALKKATHLLFGTDSTLTAHWNIWEHMRLALKTGLITADELLQSLTETPAAIWGLHSGKIAEGWDADLVAIKPSAGQWTDTNPEDILLVMHQGRVRLFDEELHRKLVSQPFELTSFCKIKVGNCIKYVAGDLAGLMQEISRYYPEVHFPVSAA